MLIIIEFDIEFPGCLPFLASQTATATVRWQHGETIDAPRKPRSVLPGEEEVTQVPAAPQGFHGRIVG